MLSSCVGIAPPILPTLVHGRSFESLHTEWLLFIASRFKDAKQKYMSKIKMLIPKVLFAGGHSPAGNL